MRLPDATGIARIASHLVVFLLCLGVFLYPHQLTRPAIGVAGSSGSAVEHLSYGGAPAGGHALAVGHLPVSIEEKEAGNKSPVNAGHLTALLLTVFGVVLGLLYGGRMWSRSMGLLLAERRLPAVNISPPRETTPSLLSVFIL